MEKHWASHVRYPCACLQSWVCGLSQKTSSRLCTRMSNIIEYEFVAGRCSVHLQQRDVGSRWRPRGNARYRIPGIVHIGKMATTWWTTLRTLLAHRCWRYFPKLAVKLPEILLGGSFNGVKLQSETFHEPGESPDQPLAVFSAGQSNTWKHRSALRRSERFEHVMHALGRVIPG